MNLWVWCLSVAGGGLVLTQSSLTQRFRGWLGQRPGRYSRFLFKLVSCPMCSGFWIGLIGAAILGVRGLEVAALGFAGSIVSALSVSSWLFLGEATSALGLWRYKESVPPDLHPERLRLAERLGLPAKHVPCPRFDCAAVDEEKCRT